MSDSSQSDSSQSDSSQTDSSQTEPTPAESAQPEPTPAESAQPGAAAVATEEARKVRKLREGVVVSDSMDKTAVVAVIDRVRHPRYNKFIQRTKKLYAHDETNDAHVGDKVRVMETRPLSKNKRWRLVEVLERAK
jgi:small subunit ribosomal protein S17